MVKNIVLATGWILALLLGTMLYIELNTVRALNDKLESAQAAAASVRDAAARVVALEEKSAALEAMVARLQAATEAGIDTAAEVKDRMKVPEGFDAAGLVKNMFGGIEGGEEDEKERKNPFATMLEGEQGEKFMESMLPTQVDMQYGQLFQDLGLPEDRKAALRDALIDHARKQSAAGMAFMRGEDGQEDIELPTNEDLLATLEEILTPEELAQVEEYQDTLPERMMRQSYDLQLGMMAGDLPEDVRALTVDVLVENMMLTQNSEETGPSSQFDSMGTAFDNTLAVLEQEVAPEYLDRVRAFIQQQRAGIEMAQQMFGGDASEEGEDGAPEE